MTTLLIVSIITFLAVTLILVALLLVAKAKLTPQGNVKIDINNGERVLQGNVKIDINNGERVLDVNPGSSLLTTLSNEKIFLPSACGGGGSCGMCKCQVLSGGGSILPTEVGFFTRKQQQNNWRLGCQVKVREDLKILVPQSILGIKKLECEVVSNKNVATFIKEFVVKLPAGEHLNFRSGGYIQIDIPKYDIDYKDMDIEEPYRADWEKMGVFKLHAHNSEPTFKAYSMANHPAEGETSSCSTSVSPLLPSTGLRTAS